MERRATAGQTSGVDWRGEDAKGKEYFRTPKDCIITAVIKNLYCSYESGGAWSR